MDLIQRRVSTSYRVTADPDDLWARVLYLVRTESPRSEEYVTQTVYYDTPSLDLYRGNRVFRHVDRDKIQVRKRVYEIDPTSAFLEVKWRQHDTSHKRRARISPNLQLQDSLDDKETKEVMGTACELILRGVLVPVIQMSYHRCALESETWRLTLDRDISYQRLFPKIRTLSVRFAVLEHKRISKSGNTKIERLLAKDPQLGGEISKFNDAIERLYVSGA